MVEELLARGAAKVYAGARTPAEADVPGAEVVQLDITDPAQVAAAAEQCGDVTLLVNNAGYYANVRLVLTDDPDAARREMEVNYFGTLAMTRAFAPVLAANGGGHIVNVLSVAAVRAGRLHGRLLHVEGRDVLPERHHPRRTGTAGHEGHVMVLGSVDTRMAAHVEGNKADPRHRPGGPRRAWRPTCSPSPPTRWPSTRWPPTQPTRRVSNACWPSCCTSPTAGTGMTAWADLRQVVLATDRRRWWPACCAPASAWAAASVTPSWRRTASPTTPWPSARTRISRWSAPPTADHPMGRWLAKRGGSAGYLLSVQVSDIDACLDRCEQLGVRVQLRHVVQGFKSRSCIPVTWRPSSSSTACPSAAGGSGTPRRRSTGDSKVDDIVAVDVASPDPDALCVRWAGVFGIDTDSVTRTLALGSRTVRFVHHDTRTGIVATDLHAHDRSLRGSSFTVGNVDIRLV